MIELCRTVHILSECTHIPPIVERNARLRTELPLCTDADDVGELTEVVCIAALSVGCLDGIVPACDGAQIPCGNTEARRHFPAVLEENCLVDRRDAVAHDDVSFGRDKIADNLAQCLTRQLAAAFRCLDEFLYGTQIFIANLVQRQAVFAACGSGGRYIIVLIETLCGIQSVCIGIRSRFLRQKDSSGAGITRYGSRRPRYLCPRIS